MSLMRVGVAGLGTIGAPLALALARQTRSTRHASSSPVRLSAVIARSHKKQRKLPPRVAWARSLQAMAQDENLDAVVELIGGADGSALAFVRAALKAGKHVITANKALLAKHGVALARLAEANQVGLYYEAAVAGGVPIVKTLRESLAANRVSKVYGILNGTCNFILSEMEAQDVSFKQALTEAQRLGLAEPNPKFDIAGTDAAQKLALLNALAFGVRPRQTKAEGIARLTLADMRSAQRLGYRIRLIARAQTLAGGIAQEVAPMLVAEGHLLAHMPRARNAVFVEADPVGVLLLEGEGAGPGPTVSALMGDVLDCAHGHRPLPFGRGVASLAEGKIATPKTKCRWFLRMALPDKPGSMAKVSSTLARWKVSIKDVVQESARPASMLPVLMITHAVAPQPMRAAVAQLLRQKQIARDHRLLPILAESDT